LLLALLLLLLLLVAVGWTPVHSRGQGQDKEQGRTETVSKQHSLLGM
jgi:hypothetical protein